LSSATARSIRSRDDLRDHVQEAFERGASIDLSGAVYGPDTGNDRGFLDTEMSYYRLLAGHMALTGGSTVVEVGTHFGGSTLALLAGLRAGGASDPRIVTMDVTDLNGERLSAEPEITKVLGDSTEAGFVESVSSELTGDVDTVYIDALKDAGFVLRTMHNLHRAGIDARWLVLDDISANESMRSLWDAIQAAAPDHSFLISAEFPHIRDPRYGYAIVDLAGSDNLPGRAAELMESLGLDASVLDTTAPGERFAAIAAGLSPEPYKTVAAGAPSTAGNIDVLTLLHELARNHLDPHGDIVDLGVGPGHTTRALAEGLRGNGNVSDPRRRIHAFDPFDEEGAADTFFASIEPTSALVNSCAISLNIAQWCGRPLSLMVANGVRTPQIQGRVLESFVPSMMAGSSLLVLTEGLAPFRLFLAYVTAYLSDHFRVLHTQGSIVVLGYVRPVPDHKVARVVENRFSPQERVDLVADFARSLDDQHMQRSYLVPATYLALKVDHDQAEKLLAEVEALPAPLTVHGRAGLTKLHELVHGDAAGGDQ
jgi:hypothetical protein